MVEEWDMVWLHKNIDWRSPVKQWTIYCWLHFLIAAVLVATFAALINGADNSSVVLWNEMR